MGGVYFDGRLGHYDLEPAGNRVILRLSSCLHFYSGLWSDFILRSIQESILEVTRQTCEEPGIHSRRFH